MNDEFKYPLTRPVIAGVSHAGPPVPKTSGDAWLAAQLETLAVAPRNLGGADSNGVLPEEDEMLLRKTEHVRRKGERLLQLIARSGISPNQIRAWTKTQIQEFCDQAQRNAANDCVRAPASPVRALATASRPTAGCTAILVG